MIHHSWTGEIIKKAKRTGRRRLQTSPSGTVQQSTEHNWIATDNIVVACYPVAVHNTRTWHNTHTILCSVVGELAGKSAPIDVQCFLSRTLESPHGPCLINEETDVLALDVLISCAAQCSFTDTMNESFLRSSVLTPIEVI